MADRQGSFAAVEIVHLAALDVGGTHRQPWRSGVQAVGVDQVGQRPRQRCGRVIAGILSAQCHLHSQESPGVGLEEAVHSGGHRHCVGPQRPGPPGCRRHLTERAVLDPAPELLKASQPLGPRIAGDQAGVDGADGGADHPIRLKPHLPHRFIDAGLIGAERAAALEHQHHLTQGLPVEPGSGPGSGFRRGLQRDCMRVHGKVSLFNPGQTFPPWLDRVKCRLANQSIRVGYGNISHPAFP